MTTAAAPSGHASACVCASTPCPRLVPGSGRCRQSSVERHQERPATRTSWVQNDGSGTRRRLTPGRAARSQETQGDGAGDVSLPLTVSDYLVAIGRWRGDDGARLAGFLLGLTVACFDAGVARRRRRARPTRRRCQKDKRAAAADDAAHLSKYKRACWARHSAPAGGDALAVQRGAPSPAAGQTRRGLFRQTKKRSESAREMPDDNARRSAMRDSCRCYASSSRMHRAPTSTPPTNLDGTARRPGPLVGLRCRRPVCDCRSSANRRGLWAPMATFS
jgi:hypothetical protein